MNKLFSTLRCNRFGQWFCIAVACGWSANVLAVSPGTIQQGRTLFERNWPTGNPTISSDGLGPLFNGTSCVACHHQGGVGGSGDARFNAQAIGIERYQFSGLIRAQDKVGLISNFFPGFVQPDGSVMNTASIPHHGGSAQYASVRESLLSQINTMRSEHGGPVNASEVRLSNQAPIRYSGQSHLMKLTAEARLFQRNTTAMFGAGLVDAIPDKVLVQQERLQSRHPEISGRLSILRDGSLGRFGWRANVSKLVRFVDRACANELSLETKRMPQATDPARPGYRNPAPDISDDQIEAMSEFIASLPRPIERQSDDHDTLEAVKLGRAAFESVGCAVCHVPKLGAVDGLYSDLLLHDMGPNMYDYDAAEPQVIKQTPAVGVGEVPGSRQHSYYGVSTQLPGAAGSGVNDSFVSPRSSQATEDYVTVRTGQEFGRIVTAVNQTARVRAEMRILRKLKPTNTSQEWKTPPLWGIADSAPYMHDGRAETLLEAISLHEGESAGTRDRFLQLPLRDRKAMITFLETLVAPPNAPKPVL
ncbi:MAG: di-heme oxidoredictase family protein [Rubripirellula sp.]